MTREEAIVMLKEIRHYLTAGNPVWDVDEIAEACDMAIEALEGKDTNVPTKDLISRQDAIEAVQKVWCNNDDQKDFKQRYYEMGNNDAVEDAIGYIDALPSADAVEVVRCKDCRNANECHKSVHYTRNEPNTVTIGYLPIERRVKMTKGEVVGFLEKCRWWFEPFTSEKEQWNEALDMAIEALAERPTDSELYWERLQSLPSAEPKTGEWTTEQVAEMLANLFGDECACNWSGIDEWLPLACKYADTQCPDPKEKHGCWMQFLIQGGGTGE